MLTSMPRRAPLSPASSRPIALASRSSLCHPGT